MPTAGRVRFHPNRAYRVDLPHHLTILLGLNVVVVASLGIAAASVRWYRPGS
jgi:hypothetical protein